MPVRRYFVKAGKKTQVAVKETPPKTYQLQDRGRRPRRQRRALPGEKRVFLVGRGPWHGDDQQVANDVIVSETREGDQPPRRPPAPRERQLRAGVPRPERGPRGRRVRTASACAPPSPPPAACPSQPGDVIEFTDGAKTVLTVTLEEA